MVSPEVIHPSFAGKILSDSFKRLVRDSSRAVGGVEALWRDQSALAGPEVPFGILQMRLMAVTYDIQAGQDSRRTVDYS